MHIKLLQYNFWLSINLKKIIRYINCLNPDIVTAQELYNGCSDEAPKRDYYDNVFDTRLQKTKLNGIQGKARSRKKDPKSYQANVILSKFNILSSKKHFLNSASYYEEDYGGSWDKEPRILLETTLAIKQKRLKVFTTHLSYSHAFKGSKLKDEEDNNILKILKKNNKADFIFAGDLNTTPDTPLIKKLSADYQHISPNMLTWTVQPFSYKGFKCNQLKYQLDYIFINGEIKANKVYTQKITHSDHLPIICELEI